MLRNKSRFFGIATIAVLIAFTFMACEGPQGPRGRAAIQPHVVDGYWWVGTTNTYTRAEWRVPTVPTTGEHAGYWIIEIPGQATQVLGRATGPAGGIGPEGPAGGIGPEGPAGPTPHVNDDGFWVIGTYVTTHRAVVIQPVFRLGGWYMPDATHPNGYRPLIGDIEVRGITFGVQVIVDAGIGTTVEVTEIVADEEYELTIYVGQTVILYADAYPTRAIVQTMLWDTSDSDTSVAAIHRAATPGRTLIWTGPQSGLRITAASAGTFDLTVTAMGSGNVEVERTITINVEGAPLTFTNPASEAAYALYNLDLGLGNLPDNMSQIFLQLAIRLEAATDADVYYIGDLVIALHRLLPPGGPEFGRVYDVEDALYELGIDLYTQHLVDLLGAAINPLYQQWAMDYLFPLLSDLHIELDAMARGWGWDVFFPILDASEAAYDLYNYIRVSTLTGAAAIAPTFRELAIALEGSLTGPNIGALVTALHRLLPGTGIPNLTAPALTEVETALAGLGVTLDTAQLSALITAGYGPPFSQVLFDYFAALHVELRYLATDLGGWTFTFDRYAAVAAMELFAYTAASGLTGADAMAPTFQNLALALEFANDGGRVGALVMALHNLLPGTGPDFDALTEVQVALAGLGVALTPADLQTLITAGLDPFAQDLFDYVAAVHVELRNLAEELGWAFAFDRYAALAAMALYYFDFAGNALPADMRQTFNYIAMELEFTNNADRVGALVVALHRLLPATGPNFDALTEVQAALAGLGVPLTPADLQALITAGLDPAAVDGMTSGGAAFFALIEDLHEEMDYLARDLGWTMCGFCGQIPNTNLACHVNSPTALAAMAIATTTGPMGTVADYFDVLRSIFARLPVALIYATGQQIADLVIAMADLMTDTGLVVSEAAGLETALEAVGLYANGDFVTFVEEVDALTPAVVGTNPDYEGVLELIYSPDYPNERSLLNLLHAALNYFAAYRGVVAFPTP